MEETPLLLTQPIDKSCRYCFEPVDEPFKYCKCTGTHQYIHHECLLKWYESNDFNVIKCELCNTDFNIKVVQINKTQTLIFKIKIFLISLFIVFINIVVLFIIPTYIEKDIDDYNIYNIFKFMVFIGSFMFISLIYQLYRENKKYTIIHSNNV